MKTQIYPHHPSSQGSEKLLISNPSATNFQISARDGQEPGKRPNGIGQPTPKATASRADSKYVGSKGGAGVFQRIIGQMPPHSLYIEPFFGSGQIYWKKKPAPASIVMDLRSDLLLAAGSQPGTVTVCANAIKSLEALRTALPLDALIYCDPPYLLSTRKNRQYYQARFPGDVDAEMTDEQHHELLCLLLTLPCFIMLSGYDSELYRSYLQNWRCETYRTRTHQKIVTESLWCNFPEPAYLHDWRFAGKNYRQRTGLKRLASRYLKRLEAMPDRKRGFVLDAIAQRQNWRGGPAPGHVNAAELLASASALRASREVTVLVKGHRLFTDQFTGRCYLGQLELFETEPRETEMQAVLDCQEWAIRAGKTLHFL
jgi:DNA adenine methylase